jgi:peroxiredoxin
MPENTNLLRALFRNARHFKCDAPNQIACSSLSFIEGVMNNSESSAHYPALFPTRALEAGKRAPDFCLRTTPDQSVKLSELRGAPVILAFYPADWSPVCSDELAVFNECIPEFQRLGAELLGISVDGVWCHTAFAKERKFRFPLLSDFEPKGATAIAYGAYRRAEGVCARALFVIDRDGIIYWSHVAPIGISPGADGILSALEELQDKNKKQDEAQKQHPPSTQSELPVTEQPVEEKYETTIESSHRHSS